VTISSDNTSLSNIVAHVSEIKVHYPLQRGWIRKKRFTLKAVDGVGFELRRGEVLGLVGESGCGKTSLGRAILRLIEPNSGSLEIDGVDFRKLSGRELRKKRPLVQMIFQDPYASLDPRMTVYDALEEPLLAHFSFTNALRRQKIESILDLVGLPFKMCRKYPHEFSGGQRQRIAIARALILEPKILIADEPVSCLDVSVQAQILNLLKQIQHRLGLSMIFISHNLAVVKYISDRIAIMYLGKIVEIADCNDLYQNPQHPYTKALISAVPIPDPSKERARRHAGLSGEPPSPISPPSGCAFHPRCPIATPRCSREEPRLEPYMKEQWKVSCWEVK